MKARAYLLSGLLVILLALASCGAPPAADGDPTATGTPVPTTTPTRRPTSTSWPYPTPIQRPTLGPALPPTPSPTLPPPNPTLLEPEALLDFIVEMLETNGGCDLPCWWGITPGETPWEEMRSFFVDRGIDVASWGRLGLTYLHPDDTNPVQVLDVRYHRERDLVQGVTIKSEYYDVMAQPDQAYAWSQYALPQVLSRNGVPSQVYLTVGEWGPGGPHRVFVYHLYIAYDDLGVAIRYPGHMIRDNQGWLICPVLGVGGGIEIQLQTPGAGPSPIESLQWFDYAEPLGELTGVSLQAFHETFSQSPPQGCLSVPITWWYDELTMPPESPALSADQEDALIVRMLGTNGGCEPPCWWGITPGLTRWEDAQQLFLSYGKSVSDRETYLGEIYSGMGHTVGLFGRHSPYPYDYVIQHQVYERDGVVFLLGVKGYSLNWSPPQHFGQDWQRYSLDQVLARFGVPSDVLLHYYRWGQWYTIGLVYDDLGMLVMITGEIPDDPSSQEPLSQEPVVICPTQNRPVEIGIWLVDPAADFDIADAFARFGYIYPDSYPFVWALSLEEAAGMDVETFYQTYLDSDAPVCLEALQELGEGAP